MIDFLAFISTSHDLFNLEGVSEAVYVNVDIKVDNLITNETSILVFRSLSFSTEKSEGRDKSQFENGFWTSWNVTTIIIWK